MNVNNLTTVLKQLNISDSLAELMAISLLFLLVCTVALFATWLVRRTLLLLLTRWIQNNSFKWDDPLASNRILTKISWFVPVALFSLAVDTLLPQESAYYLLSKRLIMAAFVVVAILNLLALLSTVNDIHRIVRKHKGSSLRGYTDAGKILTIILGAIFLISIFTGRSPWGILSVLGGLTAVTMLVFKDTILGFVASVQLTSTDMVRIGDWIEMEQYGADGDVVDLGIHCIRVQNWDKTITTIPTYSLVSSSFKNWRGMSESGGRRIKRSINIDLTSIRFVDEPLFSRLSKIALLSDYLASRQQEIDDHNRGKQVRTESPVNGRQQTNIGIYRAYIIAYLKNNPEIHDRMTFLVRQLQPTDRGLPLEIYVFSRTQSWAEYEAIQADIFDHLLAAAPEFDLRIFQNPSGSDIRDAISTSSGSLSS